MEVLGHQCSLLPLDKAMNQILLYEDLITSPNLLTHISSNLLFIGNFFPFFSVPIGTWIWNLPWTHPNPLPLGQVSRASTTTYYSLLEFLSPLQWLLFMWTLGINLYFLTSNFIFTFLQRINLKSNHRSNGSSWPLI